MSFGGKGGGGGSARNASWRNLDSTLQELSNQPLQEVAQSMDVSNWATDLLTGGAVPSTSMGHGQDPWSGQWWADPTTGFSLPGGPLSYGNTGGQSMFTTSEGGQPGQGGPGQNLLQFNPSGSWALQAGPVLGGAYEQDIYDINRANQLEGSYYARSGQDYSQIQDDRAMTLALNALLTGDTSMLNQQLGNIDTARQTAQAQLGNISQARDIANQQLGNIDLARAYANSDVGIMNEQLGNIAQARDLSNQDVSLMNEQLGNVNAARQLANAQLGNVDWARAQTVGLETGTGLYSTQQAYVDQAVKSGQAAVQQQLASMGLGESTQKSMLQNQVAEAGAATAGQLIQGNIGLSQAQQNLEQQLYGSEIGAMQQEMGLYGTDVSRYGADISRLQTEGGIYGTDVGRYGTDVQRMGTEANIYGTDIQRMQTEAGIYGTDIQNIQTEANVYGQDISRYGADITRQQTSQQQQQLDTGTYQLDSNLGLSEQQLSQQGVAGLLNIQGSLQNILNGSNQAASQFFNNALAPYGYILSDLATRSGVNVANAQIAEQLQASQNQSMGSLFSGLGSLLGGSGGLGGLIGGGGSLLGAAGGAAAVGGGTAAGGGALAGAALGAAALV